MRAFQRIIQAYKKKYNIILAATGLFKILALYLIAHNLFFLFYAFTAERLHELFLFGVSLKIFLGLVFIYIALEVNNRLINNNRAARYLDHYNKDYNDTYQNALELLQGHKKEHADVIDLVCTYADKKAKHQPVEPDTKTMKAILTPLVTVLIISIVFGIAAPSTYINSWSDFAFNRRIQPEYRDFIQLVPGNISVTKNSNVDIQVQDPEPALDHTLYYRFFTDEKELTADSQQIPWRSELLYNNEKTFTNIDRNTEYYVSNPHAVSDTFRIMVYEEPAVRNMTLRYSYPDYTGLEPEVEHQSNGNIRALRYTKVTLEIETNNALEEALMVFSDGDVKTMERLGRNLFRETVEITRSGSYYLNLTDFLGNESRRIDRSITMLTDKPPEISIVYPGRDTIFTQNMMQRMNVLASDDYGLRNLKLKYHINQNEVQEMMLQENIAGTLYEHDFIFDLSDTYMLPGDVVTYWAEVTDNAPEPQTTQSRSYRLRFPSVEEIFAEIQREEERKIESFREGIHQSQQLQEDFERKRRDMMKKDEFDWEDKQDLEQFLDRQDDLNEMIERLADDYQNLLEKFEDNPFLSDETLEKMDRIRELMEEIADENLKNVMDNMRQAMEEMDRDEILSLMEDFKFSMEDFDQKLQSTLDLLESIKKEQNLQKALAISKEMEQMQQNLLERTSEEGADGEALAEEQQNIQDKLEAFKEQLQETMEQLDADKDAEMMSAMQEMIDRIDQEEGIGDNLQQSMQNLTEQQMQQSAQNQQQALEQMQEMSAQLAEMSDMMMAGNMQEMTDVVRKTVRRLLALSEEHQSVSGRLVRDPFPIYPNLISNYDSLQLILQKLYSSPEIVLFITPKFVMDADRTIAEYRDMFSHIVNVRNPVISSRLKTIQKGLNQMIFNLMQTADNMEQGGAGGMESLMQAMQQMGQEQMGINMLTQQLLDQLSQGGGMTREMREQMRRIAAEEERIAENLRRMLETNPEAQRQASSINEMIEELESVSRELRRNRLDESVVESQERILSRLLDAQQSLTQRDYSRRRRGETREAEDWELPEDVQQEFERLRREAMLEDAFRSFPKEYRELIREYLRLLNIRSINQEE